MKILRNIFSQLHTFVLWLLISVLLWAWVFSFLTDTSREKKVMLFAHVGELHDRDLTLRLEAHKPEGIKMIKVHDFEYQMIDTSKTFGDLYIVPQSELEQMLEKDPGAVLEILDPGDHPTYLFEGRPVGLLAYDAETNCPEFDGQNYYLCVSSDTLHYPGAEAAVDEAARAVITDLLTLWEQGPEIPDRPRAESGE